MKTLPDRFDEENEKKLNQVVEKALADTDFKKKLMANPAGTLQAEKVDLPEELRIKLLETICKKSSPELHKYGNNKEPGKRPEPLGAGDIVEVDLNDSCHSCGGTRFQAHVIFETGCGMFRCMHCQQARWIVGLDNYTIVK